MTDGHKHRTIHLRKDGLLLRILQMPITTTTDRRRAEASPWVWGLTHPRYTYPFPTYALTTLGILHTLTGLTVETK